MLFDFLRLVAAVEVSKSTTWRNQHARRDTRKVAIAKPRQGEYMRALCIWNQCLAAESYIILSMDNNNPFFYALIRTINFAISIYMLV